jgi:hypothetical protein
MFDMVAAPRSTKPAIDAASRLSQEPGYGEIRLRDGTTSGTVGHDERSDEKAK